MGDDAVRRAVMTRHKLRYTIGMALNKIRLVRENTIGPGSAEGVEGIQEAL